MESLTNMRARLAAGGALTLVVAAICGGTVQASPPEALELRSQALNHQLGLGTPAEAAWMRALRIRSEALNRLYGLE